MSLRYSFDVSGLDDVMDLLKSKKGVVLAPNHSSQLDALIMFGLLGWRVDIEPVITDRFYNHPFLGLFMKLLRAHRVSDLDVSVSDEKINDIEKLFERIILRLKSGAKVLMYPGGGLKSTPDERLGGKSMMYNIISEVKDLEVVLIRSSGLWGSLFSKVYFDKTPGFLRGILIGMKILLKNLIFFTPRRRVKIEFSKVDISSFLGMEKRDFNIKLEAFYNKYGGLREEPLNLVHHYFWSNKSMVVNKSAQCVDGMDNLVIPDHIKQTIFGLVSRIAKVDLSKIDYSKHLVHDLMLDSINIAHIYTYLDEKYHLRNIQPRDLVTVGDLILASMKIKNDSKKDKKSIRKISFAGRPMNSIHNCETIVEGFLKKCDEMQCHLAGHDDIMGSLSYRKMKQIVLFLARKFQRLDGKYLGLLFPSSITMQLSIEAAQLSGKVVVPINWTTGAIFIDHMIDLLDIKYIITSKRFLSKISSVNLGKGKKLFLFLEDLKKGTLDKAWSMVMCRSNCKSILSRFPIKNDRNQDVVVLFTSGSTAFPKAVPLTHENILTNLIDTFSLVELHFDDIGLVALPPFHVFGFVGGIMPLLYGLFTIYSPDPLDGAHISEAIYRWGVTFTMMAPTFYSHLLKSCDRYKLNTLKFCGGGSESIPHSLRDSINALPNASYVEGYGLTESSPIISINSYGDSRGVGKILPSVDLVIVDENMELLDEGVGEICVRGPTIFRGYLGCSVEDDFVTINGKRYFKTGDLGSLDNGYLHYKDRKKLIIKRGGEMLSLSAIDHALMSKSISLGLLTRDSSRAFVSLPRASNELDAQIVLFTTLDLSLEKVNKTLLEMGFSSIYKVDILRVVDEIPVFKSGKVCYSKLLELLSPLNC